MIRIINLTIFIAMCLPVFGQQDLKINDRGYFEMQGLSMTVFSDVYPASQTHGVPDGAFSALVWSSISFTRNGLNSVHRTFL